MDQSKLAELQKGTVDDIKKAVADMGEADLTALRTLESADGTPRVGVINAIDARESELIEQLGEKPTADAKDTAEKAPPAWQHPDYRGPLDINQAQWRLHNIKPVGAVRTK